MSDFDIPSVEELRGRGLRALNAELPEQRTGPGTLARVEMSAFARLIADNHQHIGALDRDANPLTAGEDGLAQWSVVVDVPRRGATGARKAAALELRGEPGAVIPMGAELVHQGGLRFRTTAAATVSEGIAVTDIVAVDTGPSTRLSAGAALRLVAPPSGIDQSARLVRDLDEGGFDREPLGRWRQRVVKRWSQGAQGGNRSDYEQWVLAADTPFLDIVPNADEAYVYRHKPTLGSVGLVALRLGIGSSRVLTPLERVGIRLYIAERQPITDMVSMMVAHTRHVHIELALSTLPSFASPWDDRDATYAVSSYDSVSRLLTVAPTLPPTLSVGHRVVIASANPDASGADGYPAVISALVDSATVVLAPHGNRSAPLSWTPTEGDRIYAQSEVMERVRNAVLDGYTLGCGAEAEGVRGLHQLGPANPKHKYGDWISDVTRDRLAAAALSVAGVTSADVVTPAIDVLAREYEFPDDLSVELLIPGQVIVRS